MERRFYTVPEETAPLPESVVETATAPSGPAFHPRVLDHAKTRILKMEMKGFKSFANKTELPFGEQYNCIIGPNGSGKSNVLDSLCFVLGKAGAKGMRAEKTANLIYNGGKTKNPAKEGEVSITFDNSNKAFPVDKPEVVITRIVKQNGTGVYKINDEVKTRTEVLELLTTARIDPDGYNVILQGDIISIIEMNSVDRRMVIEEISGIGEYEDKRHKSELELDKVDQQLKDGEIILKERGTYMHELKKERDQAQKFRDLEEKLKRNKLTIIWKKYDDRKSKEDKLAAQLTTEEEKRNALQAKIDEFKNQIKEKRDRSKQISDEIQSKGQKDQVELNKQVEQLRVDIAVSGNRIDTLKTELQRITDRSKQLRDQETDIKKRLETINSELGSHKKRDDAIQAEITSIQNRINDFRKKNNLEDAGKVDEEMAKLDKDIERLQEETAKLRQEEQALLREKDKVEMRLGTIDDKINRIAELESENKEQLHKLKADKEAHTKAERELKEALQSAKTYQTEHQRIQEKLRSAEDELAKLRSRATQIREASAGSIAIQKILENKSKFKGVHGTIAELGKVSEQYGLALEVAAGGRIKSLVVDDDAVAQKCIEYLKQNKLGVATFLPLNKVKGAAGEKPSGKGVLGLAIDLVDFDKAYGDAFRYVFGSTVVVEDIEAARHVGIGKYRMVTLTGDLLETSGAMTGGFLQRGKTGMGFQEKEVADGLAKREAEVSELSAVESALERKRDDNNEQIETLRNRIAELEAEIIKLERILKLDAGDAGADKTEKDKLKAEKKTIEAKLDKIQDDVDGHNKHLTEAKTHKAKLRDSLTQLRNPALLAELQTLEGQLRTKENERIQIRAQVASFSAQKESVHQPELENLTKIFKQQGQEEIKFTKELETLGKKREENQATLKEKEKEVAAFVKQFQKLFDERNDLQEQMQKIELKTIEEEEKIRKVEQQRGSINISLAQVRGEIAGIEEEKKQYNGVEPFKSKEIPVIEKEIRDFERMLQDMGAINMKALEIYEIVEKEYNDLIVKKGILEKEREQVLSMIAEVDGKKKILFLKMFATVNDQFKKIFQQLNTKGEAFLELENPEDPLTAGMNIKVRLAGTKFLDIRSLSGGEKTMTALAFLFAIQEHEPAQFYVLDEVDAALDKRNAEKLANLIRGYSEKVQYVMISHNDVIINTADNLYGVSMNEHGESKITSLRV